MNNPIESNPRRRAEWLAQEQALAHNRRAAPASGDARVDAYRAAFHAVATAPRSEPPPDFVERTVRGVREAEVDEHIERWMVRIAGLIALAAVLVFAGPPLWESLQSSPAWALLPGAGLLGSPLLWATAAAAATAGLLDSWQKARQAGGAARA